jgi:hypothetical protein
MCVNVQTMSLASSAIFVQKIILWEQVTRLALIILSHDCFLPSIAGTTKVTTPKRNITIHDTKVTLWPEPVPGGDHAVEFCKQKGGYLAAPENSEDWNTLATGLIDEQDGEQPREHCLFTTECSKPASSGAEMASTSIVFASLLYFYRWQPQTST